MYLVVKFKLAGCGGSRKVQQGVRLASCAVGRLIAGSIYLGILHYTALPKLRTATSSRCPTQHRADAASDRPLDRYESALQRRQIGRRLAGPGSLDDNGGTQRQGSSARHMRQTKPSQMTTHRPSRRARQSEGSFASGHVRTPLV
jgi:hypothetical protein